MNKDVIYIDADDDVTAIIGKIKKSKEKIVAIVPPKRVGALQSAVNLRLLQRMAKSEKKNLVLVTNNQALVALASSASIPIAKNLQSKPEIAEIPALSVDDDDDIIDGANLPVGDHAKTAENDDIKDDDLDKIDINDSSEKPKPKKTVPLRSKVKIPDFDSFRKKMFIGIGAGVFLIALLVWMFVFAPAATVLVTTRTNPAPISSTVNLSETEATDYQKGILKSVVAKIEKEETVEFQATGRGKVGTKSSGTVTIRNYESGSPVTINAGTRISNGTETYVLKEAVTAPGAQFMQEGVSGSVDVEAIAVGSEFDRQSGVVFSVQGHSSSGPTYLRAVSSSDIDGGTSREVTIVSEEDVERAKGKLLGESKDEMKQELSQTFKNGEKVIDSSFNAKMEKATSKPAAGAEAPDDGKAVLTVPTTYTIYAVAPMDVEKYLNDGLTALMTDQNSQQIYETGAEGVEIDNFKTDKDKITATIATTGQIGPKIDAELIKNEAKGKRFGEVQSRLLSINGIDDVEVKFSFFWVRSVPNNLNKIDVEFKLRDEN